MSIQEPCCLSTLHGQLAVSSHSQCPPILLLVHQLRMCSPSGKKDDQIVKAIKNRLIMQLNWSSELKSSDRNVSVTRYLGEGPRMESPADVVAVLDSDISSVSDSMNSPNPANVLQTQIGCITLGLPLHGCDLNVPLGSCDLRVECSVFFHSVAHQCPSEPLT